MKIVACYYRSSQWFVAWVDYFVYQRWLMFEVIDVLWQWVEECDEVVWLIKYVESRVDKEKACYGLRQVVYQDRIEFFHRAKFELARKMQVLKQIKVKVRTSVKYMLQAPYAINMKFWKFHCCFDEYERNFCFEK